MVSREIIILTHADEHPQLKLSPIPTPGFDPVQPVVVASEAEFLNHLPPLHMPLAYFISLEAVLHFSPATTAVLAGRPTTFPPLVLFGAPLDQMRRVLFRPNSLLEVTPENLEAVLPPALHYWAVLNAPMDG